MLANSVNDIDASSKGIIMVFWEVTPTLDEKLKFLKEGLLTFEPIWLATSCNDMYFDACLEYNIETDTIIPKDVCAYASGDSISLAFDKIMEQKDIDTFINKTRDYLKENVLNSLETFDPKDLLKKKEISVRITWRSEIFLTGKGLEEVKRKWESLELLNKDINAEFIEIESIENAETFDDLESEWDETY